MAEQEFPGHMTTTVTSSTTTVQPQIRVDFHYIRTIPGILKLVQIVMNLLGFISVMASGLMRFHSRAEWFSTVSMSSFWITLLLLSCYIFHVVEKFYKLPWLLAEFIYCALYAFFYIIAASLCAGWANVVEAYGAAAFFGYMAMIAYGADAFFKYKAWRSGQLAQGERSVAKSSSTVTSPAY